MALFKSEVGQSIEDVERILTEITERYQALSKPVKAIHRKKLLSDKDAEAVRALKQFNFYPRLNHTENTFFEASQPVSYRLQRAAQLGAIQNSKKLPPRVVSVKGNSVRFAERVGLPIPASEYPLKLETLTFDQPCVIKPVHAEGGKCIYAVRTLPSGELHDFFSDRTFSSPQMFFETVRREMAEVGVAKDAWLKEEMIVGSSGSPLDTFDVKMYTFYGKVGLILQVDRWHGREYRFFNADGDVVDTGKYSAKADVAPVFDHKLIEVAEDVSRKIPWAHVRIDFLVSDTDWRFGEFTLRPGVAASFNQVWDRKLGDLFVKAQARLFEDLILGKDFSDYRSLLPGS
ncbi:ATP-grasp fold amidoligase family protein [Marinimicrobium agarilyticum]|uniref:ATP-grasp fold amidoligase family protein n=1 Tax=Marinimicrobium agarilyticum TaxID=306546 RepID=UPI0003FCD1BE|nr:ATP-grasp fold amidoligase family protein [Marinimicrobium agarilyticum]